MKQPEMNGRRDFLKLGIKSAGSFYLSSLIGLNSCLGPKPLKSYSLYWLHLEGAPLRTPFDLFIDPFGKNPEIKKLGKHKKFQHRFGDYLVPEVWFNNKEQPSPLLSSFVSIRGLSTTSPHLKQCRNQWFSDPKFKGFFGDENNERIKRMALSWLPQSPSLGMSLQNILPFAREASAPNKNQSVGEMIDVWQKAQKSGPEFRLGIINQYKPDHYFESTGLIDQNTLLDLNSFYRNLITELERFVGLLKKRDRFDSSVILITSDRARVVTGDLEQFPLKTETMWQGLNFSIISGALKGPQTLGHIRESHPRYENSYPGTWGVGTENWTPSHVHQFIADLCFPKGYYGQASWVSENPWFDRKPFDDLFIKRGPGQIF